MNVLGIDYGEKRIGLSFGDSLGLAVPISAAVESSEEKRFAHIESIIQERGIEKLVVGMPYNMDGSSGFKAKEVKAFIGQLKSRFTLPVETIDERLRDLSVEAAVDASEQQPEAPEAETETA